MPDNTLLFQCELPRQTLLALASAAGRAVPAKPIVSLLDSLKLECSPQQLRVTGYDLQFAIVATSTAPLENAKGGCEVLVKRDRLETLLGALSNETVRFGVGQDYTVVVADASKPEKTVFKLNGQAAADYPVVQAHREVVAPDVVVDGKLLRQMVDLTRFATSYNDVRLYFNGVLFSLKGKKITMVGTDGYRMAVITRELEKPPGTDLKGIIPSKALQEMARLLPQEGAVTLSFSRREDAEEQDGAQMQSLCCKWAGYEVTFRLIDSAYPDWTRVVPKEKNGSVKFTRGELIPMIKSLLALTKQGQEVEKAGLVTLKVEDGIFAGTSRTQTGEGNYEFAADHEGTEVAITFDGRYLENLIAAVGDSMGEEMVFEYTDPLKQGVFRFTQDEGYKYVLMPIREQ